MPEHARHYGQFLDGSDPDQSAADDFRIAEAPPEVLRGSFRLFYIPRDDSSYGGTRYLLSVQTLADHMAFVVEPSEVDSKVSVYVNGTPYASTESITFDAGQELELLFDGPAGEITVAGATTGNGTSETGAVWNVAGIGLRLGGNVVGTEVARGAVTPPYAVPGAPLPGPAVFDPTELDFSNPANSGLLSLI
jgi:hypothetical protein